MSAGHAGPARAAGGRRPGPVGHDPDPQRGTGGFSLVELVIAVMILAIGIMGMAATTGYVVRSVSFAEVRTERAFAVQSVLEMLKAAEFDDVTSGSDTIGRFRLAWTTNNLSPVAKRLIIVSEGPGLASGNLGVGMPALEASVRDTMTYILLER